MRSAILVLAAAGALLLAGCPDKPKPPATPPVPKTEPAAPQLFKDQRDALDRAKGAGGTLDERAREQRENIERHER